jgi:hypothetical protein
MMGIWGKRGFNASERDLVETDVEGVLRALGFVPTPKGQLPPSPY